MSAMPEVAELLRVDAVSVFYDQFQAVYAVDFRVGPGEIVSIIGANGAGKSSLLKAIVNQAGRVTGKIQFAGVEITGQSTAAIVAAGIALVPEGRQLFPSLSVEENLDIGWHIGRKGDIRRDAVYDWFPALRDKRRQRARELSGGQQQMVALGRALLANPRLLLCDEISLGLAPVVVGELYALMPAIRARGIGVVVVEQDVGRSLQVADRFYCLLEGRVSLSGRPQDVDRDGIMLHYFGE
jgi:branched-chain amino acid transport system ATP-binding protein